MTYLDDLTSFSYNEAYMELLLISIGLGILGIDVVGALIIIAALAQGVSRRVIVLFALIVLVGTAVYGVLLSLLFGEGINAVTELLLKTPVLFVKIVEFVVVIGLAFWIYKRLSKPKKLRRENKLAKLQKSLSKGLLFVAVLFVFTAILDPSFLALIAASGREGILIDIIVAHIVWSFVGQIPLYALAIAMIFKKEMVITDWFKKVWKVHGDTSATIFTILIGLLAIGLLIDVAVYSIGMFSPDYV